MYAIRSYYAFDRHRALPHLQGDQIVPVPVTDGDRFLIVIQSDQQAFLAADDLQILSLTHQIQTEEGDVVRRPLLFSKINLVFRIISAPAQTTVNCM